MTSMREKIARAIYEKRNGRGAVSWAHRPASHREPYLLDADAALGALAEPTPSMKAAAAKVVGNYDLAHEAFVQAIRAAKGGK